MNLIERVKNILVTPKTEWEVINGETATPMSLLTGFVLPLAVIASVGSILKYFLFSGTVVLGTKFMIGTAIVGFVASIISFYLTALIVDMLAPSFNSEKDLNKSAQLVAYSGTPSYIAGLLSFIPVVGGLLAFAAWGYGVYLMYLGIGPLKKTPEDKKIVYMLVSFVIMIAIYLVLMGVLGAVVLTTLGGVAGITNLTTH
jgi:hypothetical protein